MRKVNKKKIKMTEIDIQFELNDSNGELKKKVYFM